MQITQDREKAYVFSAFGRKVRPFTEVNSNGIDFVVGKGKSLPDLARLYYNVKKVVPFTGDYGFLDRDNKERTYKPGIEDPLVFKDDRSIQDFKDDAIHLISVLVKQWTDLQLPVKLDKDRNITLPDSDAVWAIFGNADHELHKVVIDKFKVISFILSNIDILKKACIVRGVIPGWWAVSYSGKDALDLNHFLPSIRAHVNACHKIRNTDKFKQSRSEIASSMGDPAESNVGYPFYTAEVDARGMPLSKIKVIKLFKGMGYRNHSVDGIFEEVNLRSKGLVVDGFPFAIAPIRRNSYGWKWSHVFTSSPMGLMTAFDERGSNTTRVAWAMPYIFNLMISPLQADLKAIRKIIPGLYHEGSTQMNRIKIYKDSSSTNAIKFIAEADYSNYDRFIPVDMIMLFFKMYTSKLPNSSFWYSMISAIHHKMSIIWPDYLGSTTKHGWVFSPSKLGLLSGVKVTSEVGTFINSIVNGQSRIDAGLMTQESLESYLCQYMNNDSPSGSKREFWLCLGDDTLHLSSTSEEAFKMGNAFTSNVEKAGLKGEIMIGDRFLMRSTTNGRDTPVPARSWQNTLQNETPYLDPLTFMVGLAMRTDGLLGYKTFDPFNTGRIQPTTKQEVDFSLEVFKSLRSFLIRASKSERLAVEFIDLLIEAGSFMMSKSGDMVSIDSQHADRIGILRTRYLSLLASREAELAKKQDDKETALKSLIYKLYREANIPSSAMLLEQILAAHPELSSILNNITNKDNAFYKVAMNMVDLPTHI